MPKNKTLNEIASTHLGSDNSYAVYSTEVDPSLLVPMPRELGRKDWGIKSRNFKGYDTWHGHEACFLTDKGVPVAGTLKIVYPSDSTVMVESKSLKLYLNTFDQTKMGKNVYMATRAYIQRVEKDLTNLLHTEVEVDFFNSLTDNYRCPIAGAVPPLESIVNVDRLEITDYTASENHLEVVEKNFSKGEYTKFFYTSHLLRSRCRHTKQKDSGSIYISGSLSKNKIVTSESLLTHIISVRDSAEFHELLCEKIFSDLLELDIFEDLVVKMLYARRGSIDINPVRATSLQLAKADTLGDVKLLTEKTQMQ